MSVDIAQVGRTPAAIDTIPSSPPPEVHEAMDAAAQAYDTLRAQRREMRFRLDEDTGKLGVEIHDLHGNLLFAVTASTALDVAGGGSLDRRPALRLLGGTVGHT